LESAGFITIKTIGRERFCTLNPKGFVELRNWINYFDDFWSSKLSKLETTMNTMTKN
jgi:hypothetical protein